MITFIKRFLDSLTDEELEYLRSQVYVATESRDRLKRQQFGTLPPPNDQEKELCKADSMIGAIKAYRIRVGCGLKEAKDAIENWMHKSP